MNCKKSKTVAVLSSRQAMFPSGNDLWVKNCRKAIEWIKNNNHVLLSSIGMSTWELITALGQHYKVPMTLYIPANNMSDYKNKKIEIVNDFELDKDLSSFYPVYPNPEKNDKENINQTRDQIISATADILIPVSYRAGGNISNIINQYHAEPEIINFDFNSDYSKNDKNYNKSKLPVYKFIHPHINPQLLDFDENYFIHWTRTFNSCWPGESKLKYYLDLANSINYPRCAFNTLERIVTDKNIIASSSNMPGDIKTVSFSSLAPADIIPLIRWRARFKQFSFEPYGIGFKTETAIKYKVQPVIYYDKKLPVKVEQDQLYLTQSNGNITDWRHEKELRHKSDFDFSMIPENDLILFCYTKDEVARFENKFGLRTISFLK